ncbi:MAG: hypothetical protein HYX24_05480 [Candidatus Aenigmarchaeota archaeon]|nr:hypothetical protein [Candidatus Aenigmarchaeota archaeon]
MKNSAFKGFILSLDSLVAIGILLFLAAFVATIQITGTNPELAYERHYYVGKDILNIIKKTTVSDAQNLNSIRQHISQGLITQDDMDKSLLDIIGSFWAEGNISHATNITKEVADSLLNGTRYGYEILMDNDVLHNRSANSSYVSKINAIVSGVARGRPVSGYVARAFALNIRKNTTLIVMGDVVSSSVRKPSGGNNNNIVNITYYIDIPSDANITSASGFVQTSWTDNLFKVYINGKFYTAGTGNKRLDNITAQLRPGLNTIVLEGRFGSGGYEAGDDGSTHWIINYTTSDFQSRPHTEKFYFEGVRSNASILYKKPVFINGNISSLSVFMNLTKSTQVKNVTLKFGWKGSETQISRKIPSNGTVSWSDSEIRPIVETKTSYSQLNSRFFWFVAEVDPYSSLENLGYGRRILNSSYVEAKYTSSLPFSYIDVSSPVIVEASSDPDPGYSSFKRYVRWNVTFQGNATPLSAVWQLAWLFRTGTNPLQRAKANGIILYNHDPSNASSDPLVIEFARFGYSSNITQGVLNLGYNKFELNFTYGYGVDPGVSLGEKTAFLKSAVGYSSVFPNFTAAKDDAESRLKLELGPFATATNVKLENQSIEGIPTLWGPAKLEIRVFS